ncbi:hypothetical protein D3C84_802990 [compost metagenome]
MAAGRCSLANHFSLLIVKLGPWPEADIPRLQLIALARVEIVEFHVHLAITPKWLGIGTDIGGLHWELVAHSQLMAAGLNFEIALVGGRLIVHLQRQQGRVLLMRFQIDPCLRRIMVR